MIFDNFQNSMFYKKGSTHTEHAIFDSKMNITNSSLESIKLLYDKHVAVFDSPVASLPIALQRSGLNKQQFDTIYNFWNDTHLSVKHLDVYHSIFVLCKPNCSIGDHNHGLFTKTTISFCKPIDNGCGILKIEDKEQVINKEIIINMSNNENHSYKNIDGWMMFQVFFLSTKTDYANPD